MNRTTTTFAEPAAASRGLLLTLLGTYVHRRQGSVWSGGLVALLGEFGIAPGAGRVALGRLVQRDLLAPTKRGRLVHYTLTPRAVALLEEGDRRIFSFGTVIKPLSEWTIVWHALSDEFRVERARLGRRLRFLGFGSVQDGVWLAPHDRENDVRGLARELEAEDHVTMLLARSVPSVSLRPLITRTWDLETIASRLETFIDTHSVNAEKSARLDDRGAFKVRTQAAHTFRQLPQFDPELPDDLLPVGPIRREAVALFHRLHESLREPSERYFDAVTDPEGAK